MKGTLILNWLFVNMKRLQILLFWIDAVHVYARHFTNSNNRAPTNTRSSVLRFGAQNVHTNVPWLGESAFEVKRVFDVYVRIQMYELTLVLSCFSVALFFLVAFKLTWKWFGSDEANRWRPEQNYKWTFLVLAHEKFFRTTTATAKFTEKKQQ